MHSSPYRQYQAIKRAMEEAYVAEPEPSGHNRSMGMAVPLVAGAGLGVGGAALANREIERAGRRLSFLKPLVKLPHVSPLTGLLAGAGLGLGAGLLHEGMHSLDR